MSPPKEMGITILHPSPSDSHIESDFDLDILALHGLNGHPQKTWTHPRSKTLWLRDFLPHDLKRTRIMVFGYNAALAFQDSVAGIADHARGLLGEIVRVREDRAQTRPLLLVGHSLGGLILKRALVIASQEARFSHIANSVKGVIFFGTPHQGSPFATYGATLARVPSAMAMKRTPELLNSLQSGCERLVGLTREFVALVRGRRWSVVSFYEVRCMKVLWGHLVVEKESAVLAAPGTSLEFENQIPVDATHRDICRFSSADDKTYKMVVRSVRDILRGGGRGKVQNEWFEVPDKVNPHFTGRDEIRGALRESLIEGRYLRGEVQKRFVLYGLGGSGKTQVCLKFAQGYRDDFWGVFWIDATTIETARESYLNIARACKQEEDFDLIKAWLSGKPDWLLIIDNADDPSLDITKLFPAGNRGTVLLTTRNMDLRQYGSAGSCRVDEMTSEDAVALLFKTAHVEDTQKPGRKEAAENIVKLLGYLALAIIQAGAVIRQQFCSLEGFGEMYRQKKKDLLESGRPPANSDYQHSVFTTWEISVMKIEEISVESETALIALELLRIFPFFHFDGISEEIFQKAGEHLSDAKDTQELYYAIQDSIYRTMLSGWEQLKFRKALKVLLDFSLITIDDSRRISMHPLVHEWSRERMPKEIRELSWDLAISTLSTSMPMSNSHEDHQYRRHLLPHINACLGSIEGHEVLFARGPRLKEHLFISDRFALVYGEAARHDVHLDLKTRGLKLKQEVFPPEHPVIMKTLQEVGAGLSAMTKYKESNELFQTLVKKAQEEYGETSIEAIQATMGLAYSYYALGQYKVALEALSKNLIAHEKAFGAEHGHTLTVKTHVGACLYKLGRYKEAAVVQEEVLESYKKTLPNAHVSVLQNTEYLAVLYCSMGQEKKGKKMREQAIAAMTETLGEDHRLTLLAVANSAVRVGRFERKKAIAFKWQVLRKLESTLGELHPTTLFTLSEISSSYYNRGMLEKARLLQEKAVRGMIEVYGETHPETLGGKAYLLWIERLITLRKTYYWWLPRKFL